MTIGIQVMKEKDFAEAPQDGVYIYGLFIDGARFNMDTMVLDESLPKVLYDSAPYVSNFFCKSFGLREAQKHHH